MWMPSTFFFAVVFAAVSKRVIEDLGKVYETVSSRSKRTIPQYG